MAQGMSETLKIFLGGNHCFKTISAYIDNSDPKEELKNFFSTLDPKDEVIVCTDLLGGSVNQFVLPYLSRENTFVVAGFNLPLLMELSFLPEPITIEELRTVITKAKDSMVLMNDYNFDNYGIDDE